MNIIVNRNFVIFIGKISIILLLYLKKELLEILIKENILREIKF